MVKSAQSLFPTLRVRSIGDDAAPRLWAELRAHLVRHEAAPLEMEQVYDDAAALQLAPGEMVLVLITKKDGTVSASLHPGPRDRILATVNMLELPQFAAMPSLRAPVAPGFVLVLIVAIDEDRGVAMGGTAWRQRGALPSQGAPAGGTPS